MAKVLVIEDELKIARIIQVYLEKDGFEVILASDGEKGMALFEREKPDLIVLDLMLPKISGEHLCARIRQISNIPILILSAKGSEEEKIFGLKIGADDYLTKPFSPRELTARVETLLRRTSDVHANIASKYSFNQGELQIDSARMEVHIGSHQVHLTPTEFKTLTILAKAPGQVFSRSQLTEAVQGYDYDGFDRAIDSHIKNLRQKIGLFTSEDYIQTVYGVGYKFGGDSD